MKGDNGESAIDKLIKLAQLNENRWKLLIAYLKHNEQRHNETLAICLHTLNNFRGWIREQ